MSSWPGHDPFDVAANPEFHIIGEVVALRTSESYRYTVSASTYGYYEDGTMKYPEDPTLRLSTKTPMYVCRGAVFELRVSAIGLPSDSARP